MLQVYDLYVFTVSHNSFTLVQYIFCNDVMLNVMYAQK